MRHVIGAIALACCVMPATAADAPDVAAIIAKLGSDRYSDREAAGRELLKIGAPALAAVKTAAETHADPEVRERAAALLEPMSKLNDSAKLLNAKPIKLEAKSLPLSGAIAELKSKTGINLLLTSGKVTNLSRPVTLPAGEFAPWEAVDATLKACGLREDHRAEFPPPATPVQQRGYGRWNRWDYDDGNGQPNYNPNTAPIMLVDGENEVLPGVRDGGVRVLVLPANFVSNRVIRGAGRIIFHMDIAPLPSLGWSNASGLRITSAEDEDGRPLFADMKLQNDPLASGYDPWNWGWRGRRVFWGGGMNYYGGGNPNANDNPRLLPVPLRTNDRTITMLRKFEGVILGEINTPNVPVITLDDISKSIGSHSNGPHSTLTIQEFKTSDKGIASLKLKYECPTQWALQQMNVPMNVNVAALNDDPQNILKQIKYYDAANKVLASPGPQSTHTNSDGFRQSVEVTLNFKKDEKPMRLVLTGTKTTSVEVPFKLVNVRVP